MGLRHEYRRRRVPGLDADLRFAFGDIGTDSLIGHLGHAVLIEQPVIDAGDRMPLLAWRIQIRAQDLIDERLERIQPRGLWRDSVRLPAVPQLRGTVGELLVSLIMRQVGY
ncbi:hypothetical protein [Nocardia anaemiae]|uniref:hypothetical protein n=1 Tax=Nocardia anaemiae TaxID=263910 RepID=UPI0007A3713A|nr:hypothetical protein [Nocardia anaemiae]